MRKKVFILAAFALLSAAAFTSCASLPQSYLPSVGGIPQFGSLLIELETSVFYSYQTPQWRSRRSGWISDVRSAYTLDRMKALLIEFETNVNYSAQVNNWPSRRNAWLNRVRGSNSLSNLGGALVECETSILFSAQAPNWRSARSGWLSRARSL